MITEFIEKFEDQKTTLENLFRQKHPDSYQEIVRNVIGVLGNDEYGSPDKNRIHVIDDGDYQGTLVFVIAANGYQPDDYWYVKVDYGSCSGCDTLQAITEYSDDPPTESQIKDYMTLALHIVQGLKAMD